MLSIEKARISELEGELSISRAKLVAKRSARIQVKELSDAQKL